MRRPGEALPPEAAGAITVLSRPRCAQVFFVFSGLAGYQGAGAGLVGGLHPIRFLQASGLGNRNVVWIRDPFQANFQQGVGGELDSVAAMLDWQQAYLASLPRVREVYCIGNSSGGYGALCFGHLLGAHTVWAFSPRPARRAGADQAKAALCDQLSEDNGVTQYRIVYSADNARDSAVAELLADCPGVVLEPYDDLGGTHNVLHALAEANLLRGLFPPFVAGLSG